MANTIHRGVPIQSDNKNPDVWQARIKNKVLTGNLAAVKKSIDWWCDTAQFIDPKEFTSLAAKRVEAGTEENYNGFTLKNDTGEPNAWYCFHNGRLLKGGKLAIQKHIDAHLAAAARKG
ncbi:DUF3319 domain-containing protein [Vibrio sp. SCSIO 43136]|uniref:DUF3319 domain-containing protein n=1 Tax=Vibrio sp. SCSIO 43136 TaxID=2819101 RepID=UPI002075AD66|nr:DUF3319 domain-containing protein [Vibrio sp. SCSIO 43136]USD68227.1 DUF3319 domain-containing protein [Vibrio sp. SCSIO 43136]